jgi:hypothetical protein
MNLMLSNYGHRYLRERLQQPTAAPGLDEATDRALLTLQAGQSLDQSALDGLIAQGLTLTIPFGRRTAG